MKNRLANRLTREISRKPRDVEKSQREALDYARRITGNGMLERIAQIVVNRDFENQVEREIAKLRKVIVE